MKRNPHIGSDFDDFLKDEGFLDEVQAAAVKRVLAHQLEPSRPGHNLQLLHEPRWAKATVVVKDKAGTVTFDVLK